MEAERLRMRAMEAAIKIYCCTQGVHGGAPGGFANSIGIYLEKQEPTLMDILKEIQRQILESLGIDPI